MTFNRARERQRGHLHLRTTGSSSRLYAIHRVRFRRNAVYIITSGKETLIERKYLPRYVSREIGSSASLELHSPAGLIRTLPEAVPAVSDIS